MSESFSVGEIAVFHGLTKYADLNGTECEIIGSLDWWPTKNDGHAYGYRVRALDGRTGPTLCLRKRRPPQDWKTLCNLETRELEAA